MVILVWLSAALSGDTAMVFDPYIEKVPVLEAYLSNEGFSSFISSLKCQSNSNIRGVLKTNPAITSLPLAGYIFDFILFFSIYLFTPSAYASHINLTSSEISLSYLLLTLSQTLSKPTK